MRPIPIPEDPILNEANLGNVVFFKARLSFGGDPNVEQHICDVKNIINVLKTLILKLIIEGRQRWRLRLEVGLQPEPISVGGCNGVWIMWFDTNKAILVSLN